MMSYLFLFLLFLSSIGLVSSAEGNLPPHLSFENYRSILSFANDDDSKLIGELNTHGSSENEIWDDLLETDGWNVAERNEEKAKMKTTTTKAEADSSHFPFILCHVSKSSLCGQERHDIVDSLLSKGNNGNSDSSCGYFLNPVPIYNKNNNNLRKGKIDVKEDNNKVFYATCFYSSIQFSCASQIDDEDILVTPVVPVLKIRKQFSHTTEDEQSIDETTRSLAVILSPGIFSSHEKISGFAYLLQNLQSMDGDSSLLSDCDENVFKGSSISVDSAGMTSYFFLEFQSQLSYRCIRLFMEYVVEHPQVLSIEKVAKTVAFNYEAQWITQSSIPEEKPWFEIGLTGKNQIVQVADTGVDLNHCYLKEIEGESVMHTTNWDLTPLEKKIDTTKRKVIQFVRLEGFGDSFDNDNGHGTHVVASIVGNNLNDLNDPLANGVAPDAKICFFDSNVDPSGKTITVPEIISSLFYFGREAGARIHNASWGSGSSGAYSIKSQQIDEYFHDDFFDRMLMFVAGGNEGQETGPNKNRVCDQCVSKNVVCVGASYNNEELRNVAASFSSRGFTVDERIKPDILAPGRGVLSARANSGGKCDPDGGRPEFNSNSDGIFDGLVYKSGTSMSCPIAAGSGALVRQYFLDGYYPSGSKEQEDVMDISGTLLKAILINGGEKMEKRSKSFEVDSLSNEDNFVDSDFYDEYQAFGMLNLLKSLKHPDNTLDSPDLYVVNEKEIEQDQTHEYKFSILCDDHDFRVTLVWRDPPGTSGCTECLVNDLDLEVTLNTTDEIFYPNGRLKEDGPDQKNNVERVIVDHSNFLDPATVLVKVTAANVGYNEINQQKYSLVATGCFNYSDVEIDDPDPSPICVDADQFEYTIEVFTNRRPEETSWLFQYQASGGIITAAIAGQYDELLHLYRETGCAYYGCFLFTIKDTEFNGLCCEKGMGSYLIRDGSNVLTEQGDSFIDRQQTEKFCHFGNEAEEPTTSPTALVCDDDEFKYQIDIETDLYPDETSWKLLIKPHIDGVEKGSYTESYKEYTHEGCLDVGGCYYFYVYGNRYYYKPGEYTIKADDFVVAERESFYYRGKYEEFCYAGESSTPSYGIRTAVVGSNEGEKFDDVHSLWQYGKIVQIELYIYGYGIRFIGITYETGQSFEHGSRYVLGDQYIITLDEGQYITKVSGFSDYYYYIRQLKFETNDGEIFGPYGDDDYGYPFEFDFGANALVYIFGRATSFGLTQLGFAHASLPETITDSPTSSPVTCGDNQFRYHIIIRTHNKPEGIWWELHQVVDSVPFMTYRKQLESYSHTGCLTIDGNYELRMYDRRQDGLCCYFGSGSYKLSVDNDVVVRGNHFDDAISVGGDYYWYDDPDFVYNKHEFSYSSTLQPTFSPIEMTCSDEEFEYRIRVRTNYYPGGTSWNFTYSNETLIESVEEGEYFLENYEHNHRGCLPLNECFEFYIFNSYGGLCCSSGNGGYTIFANEVVMAEGGEGFGYDYWYWGWDWEETKTFCYGPSYSFSPSSELSSQPPSESFSILPTLSGQICENGSNINYMCGYWAYIDACKNSGSQYWMHENCAKACSNCCMDYYDYDYDFLSYCEDYAYYGRCTDTSLFWYYGITWQEWMQATCRYSCGTCNLDFTPSPTLPVTCSDDEFEYEIIFTNDGDYEYLYYFVWRLNHKYPEQVGGDWYLDGSEKDLPPNYEKRYYGCAKYSCFELDVKYGYVKMYNKDKEILIAKNTERKEKLRFCHYAPEPTTSPTISLPPSTIPPDQAIFTITLSFSTSASDKFEQVSAVVGRSFRKILFRAQTNDESIVLDILDYSSCEEFICDISVQVCEGSCGEGEDPDFLSIVGTTMNTELGTGELLTSVKQTGHYMDVGIFDDLADENPINIEFDFEYEAWPTSIATSATIEPSPTPSQDCNTLAIIPNLFNFISCIFQPIIQGIGDTINSATDPISDVLFGVESYDSIDITTCKDKMFELQLEIKTDGSPDKTSWELLYKNGTIIESIGQETYSESDTTYTHTYCLEKSCFSFHLFDSFSFQGYYQISVGDTVLAQQDSFLWWKDSKQFCYPQCDDDNMFALQLELMTDDWPQETSWDLSFDNGTIVDHLEKRYYTGRNTVYNHRYCLRDGCYDVTFHDHIGDGMCCSYGNGSFKMKINDDKVIREGGEFEESVRNSFCYLPEEEEEEEGFIYLTYLFQIISSLFSDNNCYVDMTKYPTPLPSPYPTENPTKNMSSRPTVEAGCEDFTSLSDIIANLFSDESCCTDTTEYPSLVLTSTPTLTPTTTPSTPTATPTTDPTSYPTPNPTSNPTYSEKEIYASDGESFDRFGDACTMSQEVLVVGAPYDGYGIGSAYIFHLDGTEIKKLTPDGDNLDMDYYFGFSLSISDETLVIGTEDGNYIQTFSRDGNFIRTIKCDDCYIFGQRVETLGDQILTKGYKNYESSSFLYSTDGELLREFTDEDGDYFYDVALTEDLIVMATWSKTVLYSNSGSFQKNLEIEQGGTTIAVSGDRLAIGNDWDEAVYLYKTDGSLIRDVGLSSSFFGYRIVFMKDKILVSAHEANIGRGAVYMYFSDTGQFDEKIVSSDAEDYDYFGHGLCAGFGSYYAVGAPGRNDDTGLVYIKTVSSSSPTTCELRYQVIITTDDYPYETSWELSFEDGTKIDGIGEGSYTQSDKEYLHEFCFDLDSCVTFTIFDSFGDGIYSPGGYVIMVNDDVIAEGGGDDGFEGEETHEFCYPVSETESINYLPTL